MQHTLKDHFLIALPALQEGIFAHSITYLCEHTDDGAMGIVINRPLDLKVDEILDHLELMDQEHPHNEPVYAGGPVHPDRGFVLHHRGPAQWESSVDIARDVALTTSMDILDAIAHDRGPKRSLIALGYAGWAPGQLELELQENTWLVLPADRHILFEVPFGQRVDAALAKLGIDYSQLVNQVGHA